MSNERWLTLPVREGARTDELKALLARVGGDYMRAWDVCEDPRLLVEMAAAAGLPTEVVLSAVGSCSADAWSHWSAQATDVRPMQVVSSVQRWTKREAGFEEIWSTWELADQVHREVRAWHAQQQGAVVANAIFHAVESVHHLVTVARNLAEPEPGHDQHDAARYERKNDAVENRGLLHDAARSVHSALAAGTWFHTHNEPSASADDHDAYAKQILGFVIRNALPVDDLVQGLRDRL